MYIRILLWELSNIFRTKQNLPFSCQFRSLAGKILPQSAESFKRSVWKTIVCPCKWVLTTILPFFPNLKNNCQLTVHSLHFTLPYYSRDHLAKSRLQFINQKGNKASFFFHLWFLCIYWKDSLRLTTLNNYDPFGIYQNTNLYYKVRNFWNVCLYIAQYT